MTGKIESLPRWAQDEIARLQRKLSDLLAERSMGPEGTDTFVDHVTEIHEGGKVRYQPLPAGAVIAFWPYGGVPEHRPGRFEAHLTGDRRGPYLEIGTSGMSSAMVVEPWSTNRVRIREVPLS